MLSELADAVLSCAFPIAVTRWDAPDVVKGRKVGKVKSCELQILASVQPATQEELQRLPEGTRSEGAVVVFTVEPLRTVQTAVGTQADTFVYNGVGYQVDIVDTWFDLGGFFQSLATRLDR